MGDEMSYGDAVEQNVRQIAARLGASDFVYTVPKLAKGTATREVGDALLISNGLGAILQVKTREPGSRSETGDSWLAKQGEKAYRQGKGTRRQILTQQLFGEAVSAFPVRCENWSPEDRDKASLLLDMDVGTWPTIVVVDHSEMDGTQPTRIDAFWITTDDWLWLNRAIRSVTGLLIYIRRAIEAGKDSCPLLGHEAERFKRMVAADTSFAAAGDQWSRPWLTADSLHDSDGAQLYGELLERIYPEDSSQPPMVPIEQARTVLEFLDGVPPGTQVTAGRWILKKRGELLHAAWASGALMFNKEHLLVFACAPSDSFEDVERFDAQLSSLACVRAEEVRSQSGSLKALLAVGHLVGSGYIDYRYIYMSPPPDVPTDVMRTIQHQFGMFDMEARTVRFPKAGRNERCPCGSGRKFKQCEEMYG
jgi:hypothetical protein